MKKIFIIILLIIPIFYVSGQNLNNLIQKEIIISNDSIFIDTLSIVPKTFSISLNDTVISQSDYSLFPQKSLLILKPQIFQKYRNTKLKISYRVFPYNFSDVYFHKNLVLYNDRIKHRYRKKYTVNNYSEFNSFSGLKKSGSISRGITFGNNQNAGLNSDFNLQLSGKISPGTEIQANITDSNIPIQADGSSQNLREFDNVYIRLISKKSTLAVGDLILKPTDNYFMKFNKKVKGASFMTRFKIKKKYTVRTKTDAAVSKGKYNKMSFQGTEGNQGPYRLTGKNGELFIVVLSGSEKIYLDGNLLMRGNDFDYVINYNSGELSFTSKRIITKDSRIIAEFEYSEMSYVRFTAGNSTSAETKNTQFFMNLISEQDAKNYNLRQDLSDEQKLMFHTVGDDIQNAFASSAVLLDTFNRNEVLYRKTDTTIQSYVYQDIYVYSTDSISAKYRVSFSFVGKQKGNYKRIQNSANGKVYQWIAPINGIPQGDYEPIKLLISPKKKQMISIGASGKYEKKGNYYVESAFTNNDINTFSEIGDKDNFGYALKAGGSKNFLKKDTSLQYLRLSANYEYTNKNFDAFEPYKTPEFERDWNLFPTQTRFNEHFMSFNLLFFNKKTGKSGISSDWLLRDKFYSGNKKSIFLKINKPRTLIDLNANRLTTKDTSKQSEFIRYYGKFERKFKYINIGIKNSGEKNIFNGFSDTTANLASYRFNEFESYIRNSDSTKNTFSISYINREDFLPVDNYVSYASTAHNLKFSAAFLKLKNQTFKTTVNFRKLHLKDSLPANTAAGKILSGRVNYTFRLLNGFISSSSFLEHTSGNEAVKEFSYLEVQNGQGIFAWKDFNGNGVKELNEFVKANFSDEANYIRISLPSAEYKTVYNQSVYEVFNLIPERIRHSDTGLKNILSLFSNRFTFKLNRKINNNANYFNPVVPDSVLISINKTLKNRLTFSFPEFQIQINYTFINSETKNLLINGIDTRANKFHTLEFNKKTSNFILSNNLKSGKKNYLSEFFTNNNYSINYTINESSLNYKIDKKSNIKGTFVIKQKNNTEGEENLISYSAGGEYRFSSADKGRFQVSFNFINIKFNGRENSSVSYEILDGLKNGKNMLWNVQWYKKLNKSLQIELNYSGRKSEGTKIIHTGGMSIRAFF